MRTYGQFSPLPGDKVALNAAPAAEGGPDTDWLVAPCTVNRDSDALARSNWRVMCERLGGGDDVQVHHFGHWACGWFSICLVEPSSKAAEAAAAIEGQLADYPILDEDDYSQEEHEEADAVWKDCYSWRERVAYIREHRGQFEFRDWPDLMHCVRGDYFIGYACDLLN